MNILVVGTNAGLETFPFQQLASLGFTVESAADATSAMAWLRRPDAPALVLLDSSLSGAGALELCRRIRGAAKIRPPWIILFSDRSAFAGPTAGVHAGVDDFLSLPADEAELRLRIEVGRRVVSLQEEREQLREQLKQLARTDPLTGGPNRPAILEILEQEIARAQRQQTSLWVVLFDLDGLKIVNDHFDQHGGDAVLKETVRRVRSVLRPYDALGRIGGGEFLAVIPMPVDGSPERVFERIRHSVGGRPILLENGDIVMTISLGAGQWVESERVDDLLNRADQALRLAKTGGRNRVVIHGGTNGSATN